MDSSGNAQVMVFGLLLLQPRMALTVSEEGASRMHCCMCSTYRFPLCYCNICSGGAPAPPVTMLLQVLLAVTENLSHQTPPPKFSL